MTVTVTVNVTVTVTVTVTVMQMDPRRLVTKRLFLQTRRLLCHLWQADTSHKLRLRIGQSDMGQDRGGSERPR